MEEEIASWRPGPGAFWQEMESWQAKDIEEWKDLALRADGDRGIPWPLPFAHLPMHCLCLSLVEPRQKPPHKATWAMRLVGISTWAVQGKVKKQISGQTGQAPGESSYT